MGGRGCERGQTEPSGNVAGKTYCCLLLSQLGWGFALLDVGAAVESRPECEERMI